MAPFTFALALVAGLLLIEIVMMLIGASLMGDGADAEIDADLNAELDADLGDMDADFDADAEVDGPDSPAAGGIASWLGFGEVPIILWLAGMLTAFGIVGYTLQLVTMNVLGMTLPAIAAAAIAILPSLRIGRWVARVLGKAVPKTETSAISRRSLGGRLGVIAQGTASRGRPAQARIRDGHGNLHYVRVEPVDDDARYPQGTEVMIRDGRGPVLLALSIDDEPKQ
jgi:hypothetical protein